MHAQTLRLRAQSLAALCLALPILVTGAEPVDSVQFGKRHSGEPGSESDSMAKHRVRGLKASYATYEKNVAVCRGGSLEWLVANEAPVSDHTFPEVIAERVRIWQPPTGGSLPKPTLMWVGEVEVY